MTDFLETSIAIVCFQKKLVIHRDIAGGSAVWRSNAEAAAAVVTVNPPALCSRVQPRRPLVFLSIEITNSKHADIDPCPAQLQQSRGPQLGLLLASEAEAEPRLPSQGVCGSLAALKHQKTNSLNLASQSQSPVP